MQKRKGLADIVVSVIWLGYVGLPVAVASGKKKLVVGFDITPPRIAELKKGHDRTNEVADADLRVANIRYPNDAECPV